MTETFISPRIHVKHNGEYGTCMAKPGNCPIRNDAGEEKYPHFDSYEEANTYFEKMEGEFSTLVKRNEPSSEYTDDIKDSATYGQRVIAPLDLKEGDVIDLTSVIEKYHSGSEEDKLVDLMTAEDYFAEIIEPSHIEYGQDGEVVVIHTDQGSYGIPRSHGLPKPALEVDERTRTIIRQQVGAATAAAISGGRIVNIPDGIEMPVGEGYSVRVRLNAMDYYDVERVFSRGGKVRSCGIKENVDYREVSETAYYASCFRNDKEGTNWKYMGSNKS